MASRRDLVPRRHVGPLVEPLTKDTYNNGKGRRPAMLFSHNDQSNTWMSFKPEGATVGWGGRLDDLMMSQNSRSIFTSISAGGNAVRLMGQSVQQYQVSANGAIRMGALDSGRILGSLDVTARCSRSSPRRVAATSSRPISRRSPRARSMPRRRCAPR
jgi:hypothetical protein